MKFCQKCQLEMEDKYKFCYQCGGKLQEKVETVFCPYCGEKVETDSDFCPFCGKELNQKTSTQESSLDNSSVVTSNSIVSSNSSSYRSNFVTVNKNTTISDSKEPFFSKHHLLSYDGRRNGSSYFQVMLFWRFVLFFPDRFLDAIMDKTDNIVTILFVIVLSFLMSYPSFCNIAKRLHDLDISTKNAVYFYIIIEILFVGLGIAKEFDNMTILPIISLVLIGMGLFLIMAKGTDGPNQYGPEP